jgi:hypothetical protein
MAAKTGHFVPLIKTSLVSRIADSLLKEAAVLKKMIVVMVAALGLVLSTGTFASNSGKQIARLKFTNNLAAAGMFSKVKKQGTKMHSILSPEFCRLDYEDKKLFLNAVVAYYMIGNRKADFLILKDLLNGKTVCMLSYATVLDLD